MLGKFLDNVREKNPLVHNITNYVTSNDVANTILACGGSPIMSDAPEEVLDITSLCQGLNINIGTLNRSTVDAMFSAGQRANKLEKVTVFDLVGVGASTLRTKTAENLIKRIRFDVIKGNASEIKALAEGTVSVKGVDVNANDVITENQLEKAVGLVKRFSQKTGSIIVVTGKTDLVSDGEKCYVVYNGVGQMEKVTGAGCMLSGLLTAFLSANKENLTEAAVSAVCAMGLAGEIALEYMQKGDGNATYRNRMIDAVYNMSGDALDKGAKYELR